MKHRFVFHLPAVTAVLWFTCTHAAMGLQSESMFGSSATSNPAGNPTIATAVEPVSIGIAADAADSSAYAQGTRAINDSRWADAVAIFSKIAEQASEHADGALYWKAYAQNKLGQSVAALDTCDMLRRDHAGSNWIEECGALEIEIRAKNGQPVEPKAEQSDQLRLLALANLMKHNEKLALTEIDQILNSSDSSETLKRGAVYIMGEHHTDTVYPQIARVSLVEGDVRVARGAENKHDKGKGATWEKAETDLPLESGYSLVTGIDGRAEIEFEDASTMYLGENSVLIFNDLSSAAGVPRTEVALLSGTATLHVRPYVAGEMFLLRTPTDSLLTKYPAATNLRISSYTDGIALTPMGQGAIGVGTERQALAPGQTLYFKDGKRIMMAGPLHSQDLSGWDEWVAARYSAREKEQAAAMKDSGLASPIPGMAGMQGQGRFFACEPYGTCWEPTTNSEGKPAVAESVVAGTGSDQESAAAVAQAQTTAANGAAAKPARQIGLVGKPMPNISATPAAGPTADMGAFWPCIPGDVQAMYLRQGIAPAAYQGMRPWAWAVCHSGSFLYQGNRYVWVAGRRHHHPPCHWAKSGNTVVLVPIHPHDVKDHAPVNRVNPVIAVNPKGQHPIERVELENHAPLSMLKEPPKEFRAEFVRPLAPATEPHMMAYRVQDATAPKGAPVRPGTPITFNAHMQSFMMTQQEMHGGRTAPVSVPINNHSGDLQSHGGWNGSGSGFHGGAVGGGGTAHGGFSGGGGGGVSHAGGAPSGGSGGASSGGGGAPAASGGAASSGGSHH